MRSLSRASCFEHATEDMAPHALTLLRPTSCQPTPRQRAALFVMPFRLLGIREVWDHVGAAGGAAAFAFLADLAGGVEPPLDPMLAMFAQQTEAEVEIPTLEEVGHA